MTNEKQRLSVSRVARGTAGCLVLCALVLWAGATSVAGTVSGIAPESCSVTGITKPQRIATLASLQPGRIAKVAKDEGETVEAGALLVALDDSVQIVRTEVSEAKAQSTLDIQLARARMEQAEHDLQRLVELQTHTSPKELSDARSALAIARLAHELARFGHEQDVRVYQQERLYLQRMSIRAPFAGYVRELYKELGETVEEQEGLLVLVQLDPLEVAVDCPLELGPLVRLGDRVKVTPVDKRWPSRDGEITFASRVADAASQTFKVKLTVDNADNAWISGLKVVVDFSQVQTSAETDTPGEEDKVSVAPVPPPASPARVAGES